MKKTILILVAVMLLGSITSFAQLFHGEEGERIREKILSEGLLTNEEFFLNSDYILEVIYTPNVRKESYYGSKIATVTENDIYIGWSFKVWKVYKGDDVQDGDTIVAFKKGGKIIREIQYPEYPDQIFYEEVGRFPTAMEDPGLSFIPEQGYKYIIFANATEYLDCFDPAKNDHYLKMMMVQNKKRAMIQFDNPFNEHPKIHGLNGLSFDNKYQLYKYMKQFTEIKVPEFDKHNLGALGYEEYLKENRIEEEEIDEQERIDSYYRILEMKLKKAKENRDSIKNTQGYLNAPKSNNNLSLSIQNQKIVYESNNKFYYYFDVYVNANNNSTYLDNAICRISYNSTAFGTNIKQNNKVTITKGNNFNSVNYNINDPIYDVSSTCLNFGIGAETVANPGRTLITITPVKLLEVKIELKNNVSGVSSNIYFTDIENIQFFSFFTTTSNASWQNAIIYDNTYYNNSHTALQVNTIKPVISSFTPSTRKAGLGEEITITGSNFGTTQGKVLFTAATEFEVTDDGFLKGLDAQYIEEGNWSDTQIKVKIPSFVQDGYYDYENNTPQKGLGSSAGTGKIRVIRADNVATGVYAESNNSLTIDYSITNYKADYNPNTPIERVYLARHTCDHDFAFYLHANMQNNSAAITATEVALAKWREVTGLNIILVKNGNNYIYKSDFPDPCTYNVIGFDNIGGLMSTAGKYVKDPNANKYYRHTGSHIRINSVPASGYTWNYNPTQSATTTQVSFYNTILHELGHILLLAHINAPYKLMHFGEYINLVNPIINLLNETSALNAVNKVITDSKAITNWSNPLRTLADSLASPIINTAPILVFPTPYPYRYPSAICNGNSTKLTVTNWYYPPVSYLWSNGTTTRDNTISDAGNYTVSVSRDGCSKSSSAFSIVNSSLSASFNATPPSFTECNASNDDGSIITTVSGTHSPYTFSWEHLAPGGGIQTFNTQNLYNLGPGPYNVTITNSRECRLTHQENFYQIAISPPMLHVSTNNSTCKATASVSEGIGTYSFKWLRIKSFYQVTTISTNATAFIPCMPNYTYQVIATSTCGNQVSKTVDCCSRGGKGNENDGENDISLLCKNIGLNPITIYPNPTTTGNFQIAGIQLAEIQIFSTTGNLLYTQNNISENSKINIEDFSNGVYLIKIIENNNITNLRLIIES